MAELFEICGLYIKESKTTGKKYFSGKLPDGTFLNIFKNEQRKTDKHPEYRLMGPKHIVDLIKGQPQAPRQESQESRPPMSQMDEVPF